MIYLALLRGINVGGKNRVEMARLRETFQRVGMTTVSTYINSGNVIFADTARSVSEIVSVLERAIANDFDLSIRVLVRTLESMDELAAGLPDAWVNDSTMKCDVMFLWDEVDSPTVLEAMTIRDGIDDVVYLPGAIIWRVDRTRQPRSGQTSIVGTDLYRKMTVRNCNTARRLIELMREIDRT